MMPAPCQWGPTGHCGAGRHDKCPNPVIVLPQGYLIDIPHGPWHTYRCPCACHRPPVKVTTG